MRRFLCISYFVLFLGSTGLSAQILVGIQDFLTDHEADLIRVAQEPNDRIEQYLHFARLRIELLRQALAVEKPGRSQQIHRVLNEYGRIIEALDLVVDDALVSKADITKGIALAVQQEREFLASLERVSESQPKDHERFQFVLEDAIEITRDSIELSEEDLGDRARSVMEADRRDEERRLKMMTPERRKEVTEVKQKQQKKEAERKSKRPTLLKPGEQGKK